MRRACGLHLRSGGWRPFPWKKPSARHSRRLDFDAEASVDISSFAARRRITKPSPLEEPHDDIRNVVPAAATARDRRLSPWPNPAIRQRARCRHHQSLPIHIMIAIAELYIAHGVTCGPETPAQHRSFGQRGSTHTAFPGRFLRSQREHEATQYTCGMKRSQLAGAFRDR